MFSGATRYLLSQMRADSIDLSSSPPDPLASFSLLAPWSTAWNDTRNYTINTSACCCCMYFVHICANVIPHNVLQQTCCKIALSAQSLHCAFKLTLAHSPCFSFSVPTSYSDSDKRLHHFAN